MQNDYDLNGSVEYVKKQPVWAFCLLSFLSFGLYIIYWFYINWRFFRDQYNWDVYPVWRAIFSIFFVHILLEHINDLAVEKGYADISTNTYATGYVGLAILQRILDRTLPGSWALAAVLIPPFIFLIPTVKQLNFIYEKAYPNQYRPVFSPGEFVVLALGGTLMALVAATLFLGK